MSEKQPSWYEPYSRFRKFVWWWCFVAAIVSMPGVFFSGLTEKQHLSHLFNVILNLLCCYVSFNYTFKKEDKK